MLFAFRRLIVKLEVTPPDRLRTMNDMIRGVESRDVGPCGGFTTQYACMCDYHGLPYREEVAWVRSLCIDFFLFFSFFFLTKTISYCIQEYFGEMCVHVRERERGGERECVCV